MKCGYCGEENYYREHTCRAEVVAKNVEIHSLETKLKDTTRTLECLKERVEDVLDWEYLHLTTDCEDGRQFYKCLKRLDSYCENNFK